MLVIAHQLEAALQPGDRNHDLRKKAGRQALIAATFARADACFMWSLAKQEQGFSKRKVVQKARLNR